MAFDVNNFGRTSINYNNGTAPAIYTYRTDDDITEVSTSGYFNIVSARFTVGSYVIVSTQGATATTILTVTNPTLPVTTDILNLIENSFTAGVERIIGLDTVNGPLYEIKDFAFGVLPTAMSIIQKELVGPGIMDPAKVFSVEATAIDAGVESFKLNTIKPGGIDLQVSAIVGGSGNLVVSIVTTLDASSYNGFVTVRYYK